MTVEAPEKILSPQELADLIEKGRQRYPETHQVHEEYLEFGYDHEKMVFTEKPTGACALGFAILGEWNGDVKQHNQDEYAQRLHTRITGKLAGDVIEWNDEEEMALDEIIARLRSRVTE